MKLKVRKDAPGKDEPVLEFWLKENSSSRIGIWCSDGNISDCIAFISNEGIETLGSIFNNYNFMFNGGGEIKVS